MYEKIFDLNTCGSDKAISFQTLYIEYKLLPILY